MFIRIVTGIREHFDERKIEWATAAAATWWGWNLALPDQAWTNPAVWAGMTRAAGWLFGVPPEAAEDTWGLVSMVAGGFWLLALALNGTFADTVYAQYSPWVRAFAAAGSAIFWFEVLLSVTAVRNAGWGIYPLPLVLSIMCVLNAWRDVGYERRARHAKHRGT